MFYNDETIAFFDGSFKKVADIRMNPYAQAIHYGVAVFEGIRAYDTPNGVKIFKAKEHFERLLYSAKVFQFEPKYTVDDFVALSYQVLEKNNLKNAYLRPIFSFAEDMSLKFSTNAQFMLTAWEWGKYLGKECVDITLSSYQKPNPKSTRMDAKISGNYVNSVFATTEAKQKGFDEGLLTDINGYIAEGPGENIFMEWNGKLYTPPQGSILPGITRRTVMDIAAKEGISVEERLFTMEELITADAAFFTGTAIEVAGINSIDNQKFPKEWKSTIGYHIAQKYSEYTRN
jgi:branched-chain amino acid aminotransferase